MGEGEDAPEEAYKENLKCLQEQVQYYQSWKTKFLQQKAMEEERRRYLEQQEQQRRPHSANPNSQQRSSRQIPVVYEGVVPTPTLSTDLNLLHVRHVTQADIRATTRNVTQQDIRPTTRHGIHVTQPDIRQITSHVTARQATMILVPALQASSPSIRQDLAEILGDK